MFIKVITYENSPSRNEIRGGGSRHGRLICHYMMYIEWKGESRLYDHDHYIAYVQFRSPIHLGRPRGSRQVRLNI